MSVRGSVRRAVWKGTLALAVLAAPAGSAWAAYGCSAPLNESHTDFRGWSWSRVWKCNNTGGARMYADANRNTHVAWMDTTYSWFVCWRRGASHEGGNNVWYYSQGDRSVPAYQSRHAWGFMPAVDVSTTVDPHPEMPQCPAEPPPPPPPPSPPKNTPLAFISAASRAWASAELGYGGSDYGMLRARSKIHGPWQSFTLVDAGGGAVAIRSNANGRYVSVELSYAAGDYGMLRARATTVGAWEKFTFTDLGGGTWAIRSQANGLYVSPEIAYPGGDYAMLRARTATLGSNERFQFTYHQTRSDGLGRPIYFVHGYELGLAGGIDCRDYFWYTLEAYRSGPPPNATGQLLTVGFYENDSNCDVLLHTPGQPANHDVEIRELGRRFAWEVYNRFSRYGVAVDAVGHSMGGLILRAALTGTQQRLAGWPPFVFIEDAVTLLTPHGGTEWAWGCLTMQCVNMYPGSLFLQWLDDNPQSDMGTDWTLFGADDDDVVSAPNAIEMCCAGHYVVYHTTGSYPVEHMDILWMDDGLYWLKFWDYYNPMWFTIWGPPPLQWARRANYYSSTW